MSFEVKRLDGGIGAEVVGLDLSRPIDETTRRRLQEAWLDAAILLFRGIGTSTERQLALSRCFGELEVHPVESIRVAGTEEVIHLTHDADTRQALYRIGGELVAGCIPWHTDLIYTPTPNRGALLRMVRRPEIGGETGWIDTAAAYDALPEATKRRIEGLEARFGFVWDRREMRFCPQDDVELVDAGTLEFPDFPYVAHPLVWVHPESGRRSLCVSPVQLIDMVGMEPDEGDALLEELVAHTTDGRFSYVHDWEVDDMVLWDNWRTLHKAFGAPPDQVRVVHRTTIQGERQTGRIL